MFKIDVNLIRNTTKRRFQNVFEASVEVVVNRETPVFLHYEYDPMSPYFDILVHVFIPESPAV